MLLELVQFNITYFGKKGCVNMELHDILDIHRHQEIQNFPC